jgi:hypothetical protein
VKCSKFEVNTNPMKNVADMKVNFYIPSQALAFINLVRKSKSFCFVFFSNISHPGFELRYLSINNLQYESSIYFHKHSNYQTNGN